MSVKSFLPQRPVLFPFSMATKRAGWHGRFLAVRQAWESQSLGLGSLLWPLLTPVQPVSHPPPSSWSRSAASLSSPGACSSDVPQPGPGLALAQLPTMLKGQGPPATQPICQAADQSLGSEKRDTNTRHPLSQLSAQSSTEKCQIKDAL